MGLFRLTAAVVKSNRLLRNSLRNSAHGFRVNLYGYRNKGTDKPPSSETDAGGTNVKASNSNSSIKSPSPSPTLMYPALFGGGGVFHGTFSLRYHPGAIVVSTLGGALVALWIGYLFLKKDNKTMYDELDKLMFEGNVKDDPAKTVPGTCIDRSDVVAEVAARYINGHSATAEYNSFGVILGPTGTGKTYCIKKACYENPVGVVYFEVSGVPELPWVMAEELKLRTKPTFMGVVLGKFFPSYPSHLQLPNDYQECLGFVIRSFRERAELFKRKHGRPPTLFIDGADLIAKHHPKAFTDLVDSAKKFANEGTVRIVFGCSEGNVIPLVEETSSKSRCVVFEIVDVSEKEARRYLEGCGLGEQLAEAVVHEIGSRIIFLVRSALLNYLIKLKHHKEADVREIVEELHHLFTSKGVEAVVNEEPESLEVLKYLITHDGKFEKAEFLRAHPKQKEDFNRIIQSLIQSNALRYTTEGHVAWHSSLMEAKAQEFFKDAL